MSRTHFLVEVGVLDRNRCLRCKQGEDLDVAGIELSAKRPEVFLLEVVLDRKGLDRGLVDLSALLGFVQERLKRCFKQGAQFGSTPYIRRKGRARRAHCPVQEGTPGVSEVFPARAPKPACPPQVTG